MGPNDKPIIGHGEGAEVNRSLHYSVRQEHMLSGFFGNDQTTRTFANGNQWYHIVVVVGAQHQRQTYVNGALLLDTSSSGRYYGVGDLFVGTFAFSKPLLNGIIDELMIFDRALSFTEVAHLYGRLHTVAPTGVTSCAKAADLGFPAGIYNGLTGEGRTQAYCVEGERGVPLAFQRSTLNRVAPSFYYTMNGVVEDAVGKEQATLIRQTPAYTDGVLGKALHFRTNAAGLFYELRFLPQDFFTRDYTFAMWVRFDAFRTADNIMLCEGQSSPRRGMHLTERSRRLYFVRATSRGGEAGGGRGHGH